MSVRIAGATLLILLAVPALCQAGNWVEYDAEGYGFSMLVPKGTSFVEKEWGNGWAGLYGKYQGVEVWAVTEAGYQASSDQLAAFGVLVTGIPSDHWQKIDEGKNVNGWHWYKTYLASHGDHAAVGGYGIGPRGSYAMLLKTTFSDYEKNEAAYARFYHSIKLHKDWSYYHSEKYKFSMLVPRGTAVTEFADEELGEGSRAAHQGVELLGLAEFGNDSPVSEFEELRDALSEVAREHWTPVDGGESVHGFKWYRTARAEYKGDVLFALYGVNARGGYLIFLRTSQSKYERDARDFDLWYRSIRGDQ